MKGADTPCDAVSRHLTRLTRVTSFHALSRAPTQLFYLAHRGLFSMSWHIRVRYKLLGASVACQTPLYRTVIHSHGGQGKLGYTHGLLGIINTFVLPTGQKETTSNKKTHPVPARLTLSPICWVWVGLRVSLVPAAMRV